ncbi:MAG: LysM peptidoglycan-binding domain-containing protein [Mogibacterium sp.]|nr:LysM peptidoglycan-binding domain-containing protein [Mogibacterium sp.]
MKHYKIKIVNPVRFFIFILITVFFITFAGFSLLSAGQAEASAPVRYAKVVIQENDTLWNIASSYNPERSDIRELVHEIYDFNNIDANNLQPGDIVYVPVY